MIGMIRPNLYDYLKILAIITMTIDHIGYYLFPEYEWLRVIGRIAFPLFLFLVGFSWSYQRKRNIFLVGIMVQIFSLFSYEYFHFGSNSGNILLGICLARGGLFWIEKNQNRRIRAGIIGFFIIMGFFLHGILDYETLPFFFALRGRIARKYPKFFTLGSIVLLITFIRTIKVFNFGFQEWYLIKSQILFLFFIGIFFLCSLLKKKNTPLQTRRKRLNQGILFFSKKSLYYYGIHILILLGLGRRKYGLIG